MTSQPILPLVTDPVELTFQPILPLVTDPVELTSQPILLLVTGPVELTFQPKRSLLLKQRFPYHSSDRDRLRTAVRLI